MENFWHNKNNDNISINEKEFKKELNTEKEKTHLNLRKKKLNDLISSKRKINCLEDSNNEIKKNYSVNLENINNIPIAYKVDIPQFIEKVRKINNIFLF